MYLCIQIILSICSFCIIENEYEQQVIKSYAKQVLLCLHAIHVFWNTQKILTLLHQTSNLSLPLSYPHVGKKTEHTKDRQTPNYSFSKKLLMFLGEDDTRSGRRMDGWMTVKVRVHQKEQMK